MSSHGLSIPDWLLLIAANWKIVLAGMVLGAGIGAVPQLFAPRQFVAESLIAPTISWTQVQFEPKIRTIDSTSGQQPQAAVMTPERRQALVDLIRSSTVEQAVLRQLQGNLPNSQLQPGEVVQHISGGLKPRSEILSIQAVTDSPESAVTLSSTWAKAYVDNVNRVYTPPDADSSIVQLRDAAQAELQKSQDALTASLRESRLEALDRQIADDERLLKLTRAPYQGQSLPAASPTPGTGTTGTANAGLPDPNSSVLNDYRLTERRTLDDIAQTLRRLDATRESVRALLSETSADSGAGASSAAVSLIKAQLVSISGGLPAQVQFQLPVSDQGASQAELQALVQSIERARSDVAAEFDRRKQTYELHRDQQVNALEEELRGLYSSREQADAERKQLTSERDLAAESYNALARKAEETKVAQGTQGQQVVLASEANFAAPLPRISTSIIAVAAVIGLLITAGLVLVLSLVSVASSRPMARQMRLADQAATRSSDERRVQEATL